MAKKEPLHQMPIDELINSIIGDMKTISDKRHLKPSIVFKIRMAGTYQPRTASVNAQKRADELGIGDLRRFDWGDQPKPNRMKDPGRKIFHFEHVNPLNNIVESILKSKCETAIRSHIMKIKIAWILKEEDRLLTKGIGGSWRSKRPDDAYERLNIQLVD